MASLFQCGIPDSIAVQVCRVLFARAVGPRIEISDCLIYLWRIDGRLLDLFLQWIINDFPIGYQAEFFSSALMEALARHPGKVSSLLDYIAEMNLELQVDIFTR